MSRQYLRFAFLPFLLLLLLVPAAGCSNAPVAGFLDTVFPSKAKSGVFQDRPPAGGEWTGPPVPAGAPVVSPDPETARFGPPKP